MTGTEIELAAVPAVPDLVSSVSMYGQLAAQIAYTEFVPQELRGRPEAALASMLYGRELGLGPMQSLNMIQSIKGRVGLKPEAMRGLVNARGHRIWVEEQTDTSITMCGWRKGDPEDVVCKITWTLDDAKRAQLKGDNWSKYPRAMLAARATSELCRLHFPDVIGGLSYTPEELHELPAIEAQVVEEPAPDSLVDVKTAKGRLMDAVRKAGWGYSEGDRGCPAVVEASRLWGDREAITHGELGELLKSVPRPPAEPEVEPEVVTPEMVEAGAIADQTPGPGVTGGGQTAQSVENPGGEAPASTSPALPPLRPGEEPFGPADQTLIGPEAGRTLHVDLGRQKVSKKEHQQAFIWAASNGRTEKASCLTAEEAARALFWAESITDGKMTLDEVLGMARDFGFTPAK